MQDNKISVAIATFNEEENIGQCLETVKGWVDEIVVVDGNSSDKTTKIARKFTNKVITTDNKPIFHINKQMAIDACQSDWVLQLDADERVTPQLKDEILKATRDTEFDGFWLPRRNLFLGRYLSKGGQYPDYTLRLYRKGKGRLPCKSVHEQAVVKGKTSFLKNDLLHIADPNFSRYLLRFDRYTTLIAEEMEQKGMGLNTLSGINYFFAKPLFWFFSTYFRHKGYADGFPGFVFSYFSALRFIVAYIKYWEKKNGNKSRR